MTSRAVFVSAQLCFIIQVAFIPSALGSDGQSYGSLSPIQEQMVLKRSIQSQGLRKLNPVPELYKLTLQESMNEITAKWLLKNPTSFPNLKFRVTTTGVNKIVSQNSYNISGVACMTSYFVKVSPVDAAGADYGVSTNATIMVKGVPEVVSIFLTSTLKEIKAKWLLKNAKCFRNVWFRVKTDGVDKIVPQNSYNMGGLTCNTRYTVKVSPVTAAGAPYGVSSNAIIVTNGVPEVVNLALKATSNTIFATWAVKDPTCFPNVMFRFTIPRYNKIVSQNTIGVTGLACDASYEVKVSPVNAAGNDYGLASKATIITMGVQVTLKAMVAESLVVKWAPVQGSCKRFSSYEVTLSLPNGASPKKILTPKTHFVFAGLNSNTTYLVKVQPLDISEEVTGRAVMAKETTTHKGMAAGRCPYPTLVIAVGKTFIICASVDKPSPSTNLAANKVCYNKHPPTAEFNSIAVMFLVANGWAPFGYVQEYLRMFNHTGKFLVNGFYKDGSWVWGFGANSATTFPINPALLSGLPNGGDGPNDYKMLYTDSANDFALRTAPDGFAFDGMICGFPIKI